MRSSCTGRSLAPEIVLTGSKQLGDRFTEAYAGYRYLAEQGVPDAALTIVDDGASTYESLAAVRRVLRERDADRVLLVSDGYHNRRLQGIARELGMEPFVVPTDSSLVAAATGGRDGSGRGGRDHRLPPLVQPDPLTRSARRGSTPAAGSRLSPRGGFG